MLGALACLPLLASLSAHADESEQHAGALALRLDGNLDQSLPAVADSATGTLLNFGRSDLQRRLDESRQRTRLLGLENIHIEREIDINNVLIKRLQQLGDSHGQASQNLEQLLRIRQQPAPAVVPAAMPQVEPRVKVVRLPAGSLALNTNLLTGLEDWVLVAGLGGVVVLLLIWILRLHGQQRALLASGAPFAGIPHVPMEKTRERDKPQPRAKPEVEPKRPLPTAADQTALAAQPEQAQVPTTVAKPAYQKTVSAELKEVDTLIAFEQFNQARDKLKKLLQQDPANPEYLLRDYHLRTMGDVEADAEDEALLRSLMDGPLSDTLLRVKSLGQSMMPGDQLFKDDASRDEAFRVLEVARQSGQAKSQASTEFSSTQIISPKSKSD